MRRNSEPVTDAVQLRDIYSNAVLLPFGVSIIVALVPAVLGLLGGGAGTAVTAVCAVFSLGLAGFSIFQIAENCISLAVDRAVQAQNSISLRQQIGRLSGWLKHTNEFTDDFYFEQNDNMLIQKIEGARAQINGIINVQMLGTFLWDKVAKNMSSQDWVAVRAKITARETINDLDLNWTNQKGQDVWVRMSARPMPSERNKPAGFSGIGRVVTAEKEALAKALNAGLFDQLTGLYNRQALLARLPAALSAAKRHNQHILVLCFALNGLRDVNEKSGVINGDHVITEFSRRLKAKIRESDTLARVDGNEFVILMENLDRDDEKTHLVAQSIVAKFTEIGGLPYTLSHVAAPVFCEPAIGWALSTNKENSAAEIMTRAHRAMLDSIVPQ